MYFVGMASVANAQCQVDLRFESTMLEQSGLRGSLRVVLALIPNWASAISDSFDTGWA